MHFVKEIYSYICKELDNGMRSAKHKGMQEFKLHANLIFDLPKHIKKTRSIIDCATEWNGEFHCARHTSLSAKIGRLILNNYEPYWEMHHEDIVARTERELALGNLLIEAFYNCGYINVQLRGYYDKRKKRDVDSNMIILTDKWNKDIPTCKSVEIQGIFSEKPEDIKGLTQVVKYKNTTVCVHEVIKRFNQPINKYLDTPALRSINKLQQTGWRVNAQVLEAVKSNPGKFFVKDCEDERNVSKRISYNYTISKADLLKNDIEFFFAFDFDFRGRVYAKESFFNYQASDLAKGLLKFSDKKKVTKQGFKWLQVHCACSFNQSYTINSKELQDFTSDYRSYLVTQGLESISVDKMSIHDRALWVDNNLELILHTANNNIIHDCEKPVCFLAACIEIKNCLLAWCSNKEYYSDLPVPIDGSNNGWQHLGAISKDVQTGVLVGLVPSKIQNDFYVATAQELIKLSKKPETTALLASMPMKDIRKGISKRGSMTRAYSAGAPTIADNMFDDCKQYGFDTKYNINPETCLALSNTLVKAINKVCPGPLDTMKYLQKSIQQHLDKGETYIDWVSPSGFPVKYSNYQKRKVKIDSRIKGLPNARGKIRHVLQIENKIYPDVRGFAAGISPNFIHSQDAAHMAIVIDNFDGSFGAVHDSFSTHASDVEELLDITKEVFIEMYNYDNYFNVIDNLFNTDADQPSIGELNLNDIYNSEYFFA